MVGPNKQFDKDIALKNALDVFWVKGFEATSMQELVSAMGVNRASLYQTYGNKGELFIAALDQYIDASLVMIKEALEAPSSPIGNIYTLFKHLLMHSAENNMSGCLMGNTAVELGPHNPAAAEKVRSFWSQFENLFNNTLQRAVEQKEISQDTDTKKLATFINSTFQGLLIKTKVNVDKNIIVSDIDTLFSLIKK